MRRYVWLLAIIYILDAFIYSFKIFVNRHDIIQCLIELFLVILEVCFCHLTISVHCMVDKIYRLDSYEPCVFIAEVCDVIVFNYLNYFVIEGLVHGCSIFKYLAFFSVCLIGLLAAYMVITRSLLPYNYGNLPLAFLWGIFG